MFKKKYRRGWREYTYGGTKTITVTFKELERAGSRSQVIVETVAGANLDKYDITSLTKQFENSWIETSGVTWIGEDQQIVSNDSVGTTANTLYDWKSKHEYQDIVHIFERLVLPADQRINWTAAEMNEAILALLDEE